MERLLRKCRTCHSPFVVVRDRPGHGIYCSRPCADRGAGRTHGHTADGNMSPTYRSWVYMIQRCINPRATGYSNYGGRGITVCDRWHSFSMFLQDVGERPPSTSLDRINVNGNYEPANVRWATPVQQRRNRRNTTFVTAYGETRPLQEWVELSKIGLTRNTVRHRIFRLGWPTELALEVPMKMQRPPGQRKHYFKM